MTFFLEGQEAAWAGKPSSTCPYREGTASRTYWLAGYNTASIERTAA